MDLNLKMSKEPKRGETDLVEIQTGIGRLETKVPNSLEIYTNNQRRQGISKSTKSALQKSCQ